MIGQGSSLMVRSPHQQDLQDRLHTEDGVFNGCSFEKYSTQIAVLYYVAFTLPVQ